VRDNFCCGTYSRGGLRCSSLRASSLCAGLLGHRPAHLIIIGFAAWAASRNFWIGTFSLLRCGNDQRISFLQIVLAVLEECSRSGLAIFHHRHMSLWLVDTSKRFCCSV